MMRNAVRTIALRLLLGLFAAVFALGAFEIAVRLLIPARHPLASSLPYFDRSRFRYQAEPGREHPWTCGDPAGLRVAVIGDSIAYGAGVLPYDRYGDRLEALLNLNQGVAPARVQTWAVPGSSTIQQLRLLEDALTQAPDLVILGICINDTEDWGRPEEFKGWRRDALPRPPPRWMQSSRLLSWLHGKKEDLRTHQAHIQYYRNLYHEAYSGRRQFEQALARFRDACADAGVPLIAVRFPPLSWDLRRDRHPLKFVHEAQAAILAQTGIPTLDLWDVFEGKEHMRLEVIPGIDGHPNEIAHRLAAETLFRHLLETGVIDEAYRPRSPESQFDYWEALQRVMEGRSPVGP